MSELKKTGSETNIATSVDVSNAVSGVAHLSGNETFTGVKTFNQNLYVGDGSSENIIITRTDIRKMTNGSSTTYSFPASAGTLALQSQIPEVSGNYVPTSYNSYTSGPTTFDYYGTQTSGYNFSQISLGQTTLFSPLYTLSMQMPFIGVNGASGISNVYFDYSSISGYSYSNILTVPHYGNAYDGGPANPTVNYSLSLYPSFFSQHQLDTNTSTFIPSFQNIATQNRLIVGPDLITNTNMPFIGTVTNDRSQQVWYYLPNAETHAGLYNVLATTADIPNPRYEFYSPAITTSGTTISAVLHDQAINSISIGSDITTATFTFPAKTTGYARDFFVRLTITADIPEIVFEEPDGSAISVDVIDDEWANIEQGVNLIMFTETVQ